MTHFAAMPTDLRKITSVQLEHVRGGMPGDLTFYSRWHVLHPVVVFDPIADKATSADTLFGSTLDLARTCGACDSGE